MRPAKLTIVTKPESELADNKNDSSQDSDDTVGPTTGNRRYHWRNHQQSQCKHLNTSQNPT